MGTKKVDLELVTKNGKLDWKISHGWWNTGGPEDYPVIKLDRDDGPAFIVFKIKNTDRNIKFNKDDPIWVQAGSKPTHSGKDSQIGDTKVMANGKKLVVVDWNNNSQEVDLHYRLNFEGATKPLDPIIRNGGGGGEVRLEFTAAALLLTALVSFTLGMALYKRWLARS